MAAVEQSESAMTHVAPLLPPTADPPLPRRRVGFFKGLLLFWLLPRRYGPHLAMRSIWLALAAHACALVLAGITIALTLLINEELPTGLTLENWRTQCAILVLQMATASTTLPISGWEIVLALALIPLTHLALVSLGILLMPWCADGDGAKSVFRRSVKNVYWTTTAALPLTLAWAGMYLFLESRLSSLNTGPLELALMLLVLLALVAAGAIMLRALLVGASRYAGEPDGPAFRPREPRCDACGYLIIGLPLTSPCPECGLPVSTSMPGGRRRPTPWQQSELSSAGFRDLLRMQWRVLREPAFFQRLPIQNGLQAARHFWWGTFLLMLVVALGLTRGLLTIARPSYPEMFAFLAAAALLLPISAQLLMMFVACLWAQVTQGIRDYRVAATACYYASPLMWPLLAVLLAAAGFMVLVDDLGEWVHGAGLVLLGFNFTPGELILLVLAGLLLIAMFFWWRRLARALQDVRYANV